MARDRRLVTAAALIGAGSLAVYWVIITHQTPHEYAPIPVVFTLIVAASLVGGTTGWMAARRPWGRSAVMVATGALACLGFLGAASIGILWLIAAALFGVVASHMADDSTSVGRTGTRS